MNIVNRDHLDIDLIYRGFHVVTFAISFGVNSFIGGKIDNLFLEIDFLFWTFRIELKNFRKQRR